MKRKRISYKKAFRMAEEEFDSLINEVTPDTCEMIKDDVFKNDLTVRGAARMLIGLQFMESAVHPEAPHELFRIAKTLLFQNQIKKQEVEAA